MDYEKKYKEALEWARKVMHGKVGFVLDDVLEKFPELKESEDEKVCKEIKQFIRSRGMQLAQSKVESWIAWLEKQGDANKEYWRGYRDGKQEILDKYAELEKQGEQKPDDKVEPKFHEGEWIVTDKNNIVQIKAIEDSKYVLENTMRFTVDYVDKCWHKWTIKDAVDAEKKELKKIEQSPIDVRTTGYWNVEDVEQKPAPKFHEGDIIKPKDGGHEPWQIMQVDMFDKKYRFKDGYVIHFSQEDAYELVEQKLADKINQEWIPQVGDTIRKKGTTEPLYVLCKKESCVFSFVEEREYGIAGGHLSVYALEDYELVERPKTIEETVDELFKPLIEASNKQKPAWSEEKEKDLFNAAKHLREYAERCVQGEYSKIEIFSLADRIESFRPQNTWKPSEEQMEALALAVARGIPWFQKEIAELYEQLKKLKDEK